MNTKKERQKILFYAIMFLLATPLILETVMYLYNYCDEHYQYNSWSRSWEHTGSLKICEMSSYDRDLVVFQGLIGVTIFIPGLYYIFLSYNKLSEHNNLKQLIKAEWIWRILILGVLGITWASEWLDFFQEYLFVYRLLYFSLMILSGKIIFELLTETSEIKSDLKEIEKMNSYFNKHKQFKDLKDLEIINEDQYEKSISNLKRQRKLEEIKKTNEYKDFVSKLNFAKNNSLISEEEYNEKLQIKLLEMSENEKI